MIRSMTALLFCGFIIACNSDEEHSSESANQVKSALDRCNPESLIDNSDCKSEIEFSEIATKSQICTENGIATGACELKTCQLGYLKQENKCLPAKCEANESYGVVSCTSNIPFSLVANKSKNCNDVGSDFVFGDCRVEECQTGYYKSENSCLALACSPSQDLGFADCKSEIPFATAASKTKSCDAQGTDYVYGSCVLGSCEIGYYKQNNSCIPNVCTPNQTSDPVSCTFDISYSSSASRTKTCNAQGSGYDYGACTLGSCQSGFYSSGNSCLPQACQPNSVVSMDCPLEVQFATEATKLRTCNSDGSSYSFGMCTVKSCTAGYTLQSNTCVYQARPIVSMSSYNSFGYYYFYKVDDLGRVIQYDRPISLISASYPSLPLSYQWKKYMRDGSDERVLTYGGETFEILNGDLTTDIFSPWQSNLKDLAIDYLDRVTFAGNTGSISVNRKYGLTNNNRIWMQDNNGHLQFLSPKSGTSELPPGASSINLISSRSKLSLWVIDNRNHIWRMDAVEGSEYTWTQETNINGALPSGASSILSAFSCQVNSKLCVLVNSGKVFYWDYPDENSVPSNPALSSWKEYLVP